MAPPFSVLPHPRSVNSRLSDFPSFLSSHLLPETRGTSENPRDTSDHLKLVGATKLWATDTRAGNFGRHSVEACG